MVESQPSKLLVAGSIPVSRSKTDLVLRQTLCSARKGCAAGEARQAILRQGFFTLPAW